MARAVQMSKGLMLILTKISFPLTTSLLLVVSPVSLWAKSVKYQVEFSWDRVDGAAGYEIEFKDRRNKKTQVFKSKRPRWSGGLGAAIYDMRIRTLDQRSVPGAWSDKTELAVLPPGPQILSPKKREFSKSTDLAEVSFRWKPMPGIKSYLLRVTSALGFKEEKVVEKSEAVMKLPVAQRFSYQVFSQVEGVETKKLSAKIHHLTHFGVARKPDIHAPTNEFVESVDWKKAQGSHKYSYWLYQKKGEKWKRVLRKKTKKLEARIPKKLPGGKYKLKVRSYGKLRKKSKSSIVEFDMAEERGPAAVKQAKLKEAVVRPSKYHVTGSYIVTNLSYAAENPETSTKTSFDALGGSGRIGVGYTPRKKKWGLMSFAEFSGFSVGGQTFTYFGLEGEATYRKSFGAKVLKVGSGFFLKELPQTLTSVINSSSLELEKIRFMGPHLGVSYAIPFTNSFGVQLNTRLYYGLISMGTPNDQGIGGTLSMQASMLASYRVNRRLTALLGYAYKKDAINYQALSSSESTDSFASDGDINSVSLSGHYLNLMLEWGF